MDITKLSDEELMALSPVDANISNLSDEELMALSQDTSSPLSKEVVDEQHPAISWKDRAVVKNFGGTVEEQKQYLQSKYPNLQIDVYDDEIVAKGKNEKEWRKLDPSSFEGDDITDIIWDVGSGIAEGAATVGGALLGTAAAPGAGTVAGGMAAAGATGTGLEALRQGIGEYLGAAKFDVGEALKTGAISAALTPVFGVGGGKKLASSMLKSIEKSGIQGAAKQEAIDAGLKALTRVERGAVGNVLAGVRGTGPGLAQISSGVKARDWETYWKNMDEIDSWDSTSVKDIADNLHAQLTDAVESRKKELSLAYEELKETGKYVDISDTMNTFNNKRDEVLSGINQQYNAPLYNKVEQALKDIETTVFSSRGQRASGMRMSELSVADAITAEQTLKDMFVDNMENLAPQDRVVASYINKVLGGKDTLYKSLSNNLDQSFKNLGPSAYNSLKRRYKDIATLQDVVYTVTKTPKKTLGALLGIDTKAGQKLYDIVSLSEVTQRLNIPYEETARKLRAYTFLKDPSWMPISGTATSTSRSMLGSAIGGTLGFVGGGGNPITAAAGAAGGALLGSPASMKRMGEGIRWSSQKGSQVGGVLPGRGLYRGTWNIYDDESAREVQKEENRPY